MGPDGAQDNGSPYVGNGYGHNGAPALAIRTEPIQVTPGEPAQVNLAVRNDSGTSGLVQFEILGLATDWAELPASGTPLAPGQTLTTSIGVTVPAGYPPSNVRAAVRASLLSPESGKLLARPSTSDLLLRVAETGLLDASMPSEVFGSFRGRFDVSVRNRGREEQQVGLSATSPVGARIRWSEAHLRLPAGVEETVRAEVEYKRALTGLTRRVPFSVKVEGRGAPVTLGGTFVQRPWLSAWLLKTAAIVATVLVMAALAVLIVLRLTSTYAPKVTTPPPVKAPPTVRVRVPAHRLGTTSTKSSTASTEASTGPASTGPAATGTAGTGPAGATASTTPGAATTASTEAGATPGSHTSGTPGSTVSTTAPAAPNAAAGGASGGALAAAPVQMVSISGQVTAAVPGGVTVTVQPASLVNGAAAPGGGGTGPFGRSSSTETIGDGSFSFPKQFPSPADYLVTFSKPGYATQKYVVAASGAPIQLTVKLVPGPAAFPVGSAGPPVLWVGQRLRLAMARSRCRPARSRSAQLARGRSQASAPPPAIS